MTNRIECDTMSNSLERVNVFFNNLVKQSVSIKKKSRISWESEMDWLETGCDCIQNSKQKSSWEP